MKKQKTQKKLKNLPQIIKHNKEKKDISECPVDHYSYSSLVLYSSNPILFKIRYINKDNIYVPRNVSGVIGNAFHNAMETYYSKETKGDRMKKALEDGMRYLSQFDEGGMEYNTVIKNKQKAQELLAFGFNEYVKNVQDDSEIIACEKLIDQHVSVKWHDKEIDLPIPLKGYIDKIIRKDGKLKVVDYKTTRAFSNPEKIDGAKIVQAVQYYFLVYAEYGEPPYSMIYEEVKMTKNRDGSKQVKPYEMVYEENPLFFDFYFRLYDDVTRAINGEAVFVPNIRAMFDNEIAIISYIHRLDESEEMAKQMKENQVDNITDLLKKKIQNAGNMRKFYKAVEKKFISAKSLNYNKMVNAEKIKNKLMEHGMLISYEGKIVGNTVTLYKFDPGIGLKMSKLLSYTKDIELVLGVTDIRVLAPIPNTTLVGFEVPNETRKFVDTLPSPKGFELAMGVDILGKDYFFDIREAPHMLVAGASGSGKSVFLNAILEQIQQIPNVGIHLFDPKMVELLRFSDSPKTKEYETDVEAIHDSLEILVDVMNTRYSQLRQSKCRNITEYNKNNSDKMDTRFVVIDEFGDLTVSNHVKTEVKGTGEYFERGKKKGCEKTETIKTNLSKEILKHLTLLAQKARAAGIHIIIATQRPSTDVITGTIKANFPTKVAFKTAKEVDSHVLLDNASAASLLGKGDMIFSSDKEDVRLQGYNA